ncbi:hypothetical protein Ocin01_10115 [Orchesella cincta]|uniref:Uncharacterized protein n=1 Tax=Orchesella cincta TaxID=48709 RepID=A0A1D2MU05_ORCCI|nr:hypothetical protein Ocin01_10115 [Orchesella cincta]
MKDEIEGISRSFQSGVENPNDVCSLSVDLTPRYILCRDIGGRAVLSSSLVHLILDSSKKHSANEGLVLVRISLTKMEEQSI